MRYLITILFCLFFSSSLAAKSTYYKPFNINLDLSENWIPTASSKPYILAFTHRENIASINITKFAFPSPVTINGFQESRRVSKYDNWIAVTQREGTVYESKSANVNDSYVSVFSKNILQKDLSIERKIIAEYYFLLEKSGYVLTFDTNRKNWQYVKNDIKKIKDSFWYGKIEKPNIEKQAEISNSWQMVGKSSDNLNYSQSPFRVQSSNKELWEFMETKDGVFRNTYISPVIEKETLFSAIQDKVFSFDINKGVQNWSFQVPGIIDNHLSIYDGILFLTINYSPQQMIALMADNGQTHFKVELSDTNNSKPVFTDNKIIFISGTKLVCLNIENGNEVWSRELNLNYKVNPTLNDNNIYVVDQFNTLYAINASNSSTIWSKSFEHNLKVSPSVYDKQLIVSYDENLTATIVSLSVKDGRKLWHQQFKSYLITQPVTISNKRVTTLLKNKTNQTQFILQQLDIDTGDVKWNTNIASNDKFRPLSTDKYILLQNEQTNIIAFDLDQGTQIDSAMLNPTKNLSYKINDVILYKDKLFFTSETTTSNKLSCYIY